MPYVTSTEVYRTAGLTTSEVSSVDVEAHITRAEVYICRLTKNIYWNIILDTQQASSGAASSITKTGASWVVNAYANMYVWIYAGTGSVQLRKILSNTADTLTIDRAWTSTNPDATSYFKVFYVPPQFNPYIDASYDGNDQTYFFLPYYPVKKVETLTINSVSVTPTYVYLYEKTGQIKMKAGAEYSKFTAAYPLDIEVKYWYGVDNLPYEIRRAVELQASIQILGQQMGGTFDDPSTVVLPEATVTIGQAYINIRSTLETLKEEYNVLLNNLKVYPVFG
jgi:hypothetical protein